jgi:competence protein ComEC
MLAGDIEQGAEAALCVGDEQIDADLLKVPHHGSKTSSTGDFIDRVKPRYAVISVGQRSRFGHPNPEVVSRYLKRGIQVLETGRDGMVTIETDGDRIAVNTFLGGPIQN